MTHKNHDNDLRVTRYNAPSGGWGSAKSVTKFVLGEGAAMRAPKVLKNQNKVDGAMCVSCAWAKPATPHPLEFCENGAKATVWETTSRRTDPKFFAQHTLTELEGWSDYDLESVGRLMHPMKWDAKTDTYVPVRWEDAFEEIGRELRAINPKQAEMYVSGRASLETSYMWQLFARIYGTNNLPDSSNMCHESSSVGLPESIGASVGTAVLSDFQNCDCIFYIGQNVATSSPRLLHELQAAVKRGVKIVTFNPLRERGLEEFVNPQSPTEMLTQTSTHISSRYYQLRNGGDIAAIFGVAKALIEADDILHGRAPSPISKGDTEPGDPQNASAVAFAASIAAAENKHVLDHTFINDNTLGFEEFAAAARSHTWEELEKHSGLTRTEMQEAAKIYAESDSVLICYGMGITQHIMGVENVHMIANLALLRGNIGKPGANICAIRGHSNVQGQRTVGVTEKPDLAPLDKLSELYHFTPSRDMGHSTVETCQAILDGEAKAFLSLGGNFLRAIPETEAVEEAWRKLRLTVQIATKLNRSHVIHGEIAYLLPCLGRLEIDRQETGEQHVTMESSLAHFHASRGQVEPISDMLLSEPAIVAGLAKATLVAGDVPWDFWVADYARIRNAIELTYPETFRGFNTRAFLPGGMARPLPARERKWVTSSGKANFLTPKRLFPLDEKVDTQRTLNLMTLRSNDQFNTTVYGYSDRFRGISGSRDVIFMNPKDIQRLGLKDGMPVTLTTAIDSNVHREVKGFTIVPYNIPEGSCGAYFPETNPLFPLSHHDPKSKTPAYKLLPVSLSPSVA